ncbi:MAG: hypothetical protein ABI566_09255 [Pseudolysinimonas sp.]
MTRSRKIMAGLGMLLVLALAGCVRFQADLSVDDQNRLDGDIVVAVITNDEPGSADNARDNADKIEAQLLPELRGADGVTAQAYEQDDYVGTRFTLSDTPIEALNGSDADGALTLTRTGDTFEFSGTLDFTPDDEPLTDEEVQGDPQDSNITVAISFPGEVLDHNGELNGTKVTWTTTLEGSVDMHATASAISSGPPVALIVIIVLIALAVIAVVVVVLVRRRRVAA